MHALDLQEYNSVEVHKCKTTATITTADCIVVQIIAQLDSYSTTTTATVAETDGALD